jgi:hypothetical protein
MSTAAATFRSVESRGISAGTGKEYCFSQHADAHVRIYEELKKKQSLNPQAKV